MYYNIFCLKQTKEKVMKPVESLNDMSQKSLRNNTKTQMSEKVYSSTKLRQSKEHLNMKNKSMHCQKVYIKLLFIKDCY